MSGNTQFHNHVSAGVNDPRFVFYLVVRAPAKPDTTQGKDLETGLRTTESMLGSSE